MSRESKKLILDSIRHNKTARIPTMYRGEPSVNKKLMEYFNISFSSERFAALTKVVWATAELGDNISIRLLRNEINEALIFINAVARKLNFKDREFDIVFVGSVFRCEKYFKQIFMDKLKKKYPKIKFADLSDKPVSGAIKMAIKNL